MLVLYFWNGECVSSNIVEDVLVLIKIDDVFGSSLQSLEWRSEKEIWIGAEC